MTTNCMQIAQSNELKVLKAIHKFGWLRSKDLAALIWSKHRNKTFAEILDTGLDVSDSALRMAQRTIKRLRQQQKVLKATAIDNSEIYGLAQAGANQLRELEIPASSGRNLVRSVSSGYFHHRRISNEIALLCMLGSYKVSGELEVQTGNWFAGEYGIYGKKPDVVARQSRDLWLFEVERSRKNQKDYEGLIKWLLTLKVSNHSILISDQLYTIRQVVFVCTKSFKAKIEEDLKKVGWTEAEINLRVHTFTCLYNVSEVKLIRKSVPKSSLGG